LKVKLALFFIGCTAIIHAQTFAPQVGIDGTTAIHKDDAVFVDWANNVIITRGYLDIALPNNGVVDYGEVTNANGQANNNIVSLGDAGEVILTFSQSITNGQGADFAVFENGFLLEEGSELAFLELAFVEVSTDGIEYVRFPAFSEEQTNTQTDSFGYLNARNIHNLAGKYIANYGTPFDLEDLSTLIQGTTVNLNNINYIKLIDVVGSIDSNFATYDSENNLINDPYPTAFSSGGFDLDAVGVIHNNSSAGIHNVELSSVKIFPNPVKDLLKVQSTQQINKLELFTIRGERLISSKTNYLDVRNLPKGVYFLKIIFPSNKIIKRFIKN